MALVLIPPTATSVYLDVATSPLDRALKVDPSALQGNGMIRPFQRDAKNDFANASGLALIKSGIGQILATRASSPRRPGELAWRPDFGSRLDEMRHQANPTVLTNLGRKFVADAVASYEPRIVLRAVQIQKTPDQLGQLTILVISMTYDVVAQSVASNRTLFQNVNQTVSFPGSAAA